MRFSAFYSTALPTLLDHLRVSTLVLTGLATHMSVLMTAADAHMRDFALIVPQDCVASEDPRDQAWALRHMATVFDADVRPSTTVDLGALVKARPAMPAHGPVGRDDRPALARPCQEPFVGIRVAEIVWQGYATWALRTPPRTSSKRSSQKRDLVKGQKAAFYAKCVSKGRFNEMDEWGRSLAADRRRKATRRAEPGYGDRGDRVA